MFYPISATVTKKPSNWRAGLRNLLRENGSFINTPDVQAMMKSMTPAEVLQLKEIAKNQK